MSELKSNPEYEQMKAKAPHILAEMVQMLIAWRKMGFHVPRGVKNIFEFTWDELITSTPRKSFSGLYCPVVNFVSFDEEPLCFTAASKVQKVGLAASMLKPNYVTPSLENQEMLHKFQQRSVHLLSELLKMKMKIMIDAVAGPSTVEIARRLLEGGQQLSPKSQEEAVEFMTKEPKKKALPKNKGGSSEGSSCEPRLDPCPQAREKLREICRHIAEEKAASAAKGHTRPLILRNYMVVQASPSMAMKRFPTGSGAAERRFRGKKFYFAFPDGTSFLFCSIALLMNQEGGSIRDKDGYLTHRWSWHSKKQFLRSLEFQASSQSTEAVEQEIQWNKVLAEIKKRFEKTVKQFVNGVLLASGICCIDYPIGASSKRVKFSLKDSPPQAWERRLREQTSIAMSESKGKPRKPSTRAPPSGRLASSKPFTLKLKHPSRLPTAGETHPAVDTWAACPGDCPIVLRKLLAKEEDITCCKCVVKIPLLTDLEFEKFIRASRDPYQVLVICVLSPQNHSYSPYFEWSLEKLYIQMQHGRPSPCVQCKHDPFRFLKYDLDSPLNKKPPLLVQKHGVVPGMVVMYAGGKLLFGGCVFNGYSYSKRDLLKQINQVRLSYKMGHFLPQSFKFSPITTTDFPKKPATLTEEERAQEAVHKGEPPAVEIKKLEEEQEVVVVVEEPEMEKKPKRVTSGKKGKRK